MNNFDKLTQDEKLASLARLDSASENKNRESLFVQTMNKYIELHKENHYSYDKPEKKESDNAK